MVFARERVTAMLVFGYCTGVIPMLQTM